jgi:hypothetical protein
MLDDNFYGNIYLKDNIYFVDPAFMGSPEKQRFSKFNDPLDETLYLDQTRTRCYKAFYKSNLQMFVISESVLSCLVFPAQSNAYGKGRGLPE